MILWNPWSRGLRYGGSPDCIRKPGNQVLLLERQTRGVGKKLSATGNGRCNLTNLHASEGAISG